MTNDQIPTLPALRCVGYLADARPVITPTPERKTQLRFTAHLFETKHTIYHEQNHQ